VRAARFVLKRALLGLTTVWAVVSAVFLLFVGTRDWYLGSLLAQMGRDPNTSPEDVEQTRQEYLAERGLDGDLGELYVEWMWNTFTFQWGDSFKYGRDALEMVLSGTARTAAYVIPAILLAVLVGIVVGLVTGMWSDATGEAPVRSGSYAGMAVPNFWIGAVLLTLATGAGVVFRPVFLTGRGQGMPTIAVAEFPFLYAYVLPPLLVATTLLAGVVSYARAYSMQYYADDLTKLVRAKGGGRGTVARHVVRNAAVPLVSLLFTETLALIALSVFVVEAVFAIDGIGSLFYNAVWVQDLPILMGATMVFVTLGVVGNLVQDLLHAALDPRLDTSSL
jgi:peptide/nickel transport system permease protein